MDRGAPGPLGGERGAAALVVGGSPPSGLWSHVHRGRLGRGVRIELGRSSARIRLSPSQVPSAWTGQRISVQPQQADDVLSTDGYACFMWKR